MADLEKVADQGTPLLADLGEAAPQMDRLIRGLGAVSQAGPRTYPSLGDALERGRPALITFPAAVSPTSPAWAARPSR